jgi:hypothetical protein
MASGEITVNIRCVLDVSRRDAETSLRIVEAFMNNHAECDLLGHKEPDGTMRYEIIERSGPNA